MDSPSALLPHIQGRLPHCLHRTQGCTLHRFPCDRVWLARPPTECHLGRTRHRRIFCGRGIHGIITFSQPELVRTYYCNTRARWLVKSCWGRISLSAGPAGESIMRCDVMNDEMEDQFKWWIFIHSRLPSENTKMCWSPATKYFVLWVLWHYP